MNLDFETGAVLLMNKPYKWTSFDVVNYVRRIAKVKVGHAGTLDPLATGLLILCTGKMTKQIDAYQAQEKEYTGIIKLGATTPSFDLETEIDATFPINGITSEAIHQAVKLFQGTLQQIPPAHSAKRVDGERAYHKARRGETVEVKPREVTVSEFEITKVDFHEESIDAHFRVICSKGTYIRSLARDLGLALNNGGHLTQLIRTRIGNFLLSDAKTVEDLRVLFPLPIH
ncbi:MAG: tRNA pseudouridine(55) synthase TruB [Bacteroidetes bacterium]|nr:tRNA pseudouridine(55) synthase TruB [Bacteroidota bacterium]